MKTYIITGGAGFIGSHLIEKIISLGNNVICIDDLSSGFKSNIESLNKISFFSKKGSRV
jgi:nucleoside-diphosphate-sugar epimerase